MRHLIAGVCLMLLPAAAQIYTPESFAAEVERIQASLESETPDDVAANLPASWSVEMGGKRYSISTERLHAMFEPKETPADVRIADAQAYLSELLRQVNEAAAEHTAGTGERQKLEEVLKRSEFGGVKQPSAWNQFWQRVLAAIARIINEILAFAAGHPTASQILFWTVLSGGVLFLAWWLYRIWSRGQEPPLSHTPEEEGPGSRSWQQWMLAARDAAQLGDSREAIRCGYWAGVARLQEDRLLPARLSKTPRECLRLIAGPPQEPLRGLTTSLERFWYAGQGAVASDVEQTFRHLEALGCRPD